MGLYSKCLVFVGRTNVWIRSQELDPWISTYSVNLICKRRNIASGTRYAQERRKLGREIKNSLRQDREN